LPLIFGARNRNDDFLENLVTPQQTTTLGSKRWRKTMPAKTRQFGSMICLMMAGALALGCSSRDDKQPGAPGAETQRNSSASTVGAIQPCKILTAAQVGTVLPNHDDGMVTDSGDSITKGIKSYGCSYVNKETNLLTVVLSIAENEERFSWIKPSEGSHRDDRKIEIGDYGWVYGDPNNLKVEVVQGLTVIDLKLMAPGAQAKSAEMIELARAIAQGLRK
jgi:hypothetical protein